jgi:F-type H+-transporting ATPase subunit delta
MPISAAATRYANALADVVTAPASAVRPEAVLAELRSFESVMRASEELQNALVTPAVPVSRKRAVVARIAALLDLSGVARNFLYVLLDHRRIAELADILQTLEEVLDQRLGFARAEVTAARELTEAQRKKLHAELERISGKRIRARFGVDSALIGGVMARIGSTVYDGSVRGQLQALGRRLDQGI